jgi:guanylate kinase
MFGKYRIVSVKFRSANTNEYDSKEYTFFSEIQVEEGDLVIALTRYGPTVGKVYNTRMISSAKKSKAGSIIICKIDLDDIKVKRDKFSKILLLKEELKSKKEEIDELMILKHMAKNDSYCARLLSELYELTGDESLKIEHMP